MNTACTISRLPLMYPVCAFNDIALAVATQVASRMTRCINVRLGRRAELQTRGEPEQY